MSRNTITIFRLEWPNGDGSHEVSERHKQCGDSLDWHFNYDSYAYNQPGPRQDSISVDKDDIFGCVSQSILVAWFIIARVAFWIGYHRSYMHRAFGMAATHFPNYLLIFYVAYRVAASAI